MSHTEIGLCISFVLLLIAVITAAVKITQHVNDREAAMRKDWRTDLVSQERDLRDRDEETRNLMGEQGHAVRTKIHDLETWVRDKLVSKDTFELVTGRLEKSIDRLGEKVENLPDRIMQRMDGKAG